MIDWTTVGFTGHRELSNEGSISDRIGEVLTRLSKGRSLVAAASAASGADTLFLEQARDHGLPAFIILPFPKDRFRQDFPADAWERVLPLIDEATHVEMVSAAETGSEAYLECGVRTAEKSDVLVAVWDGREANGAGGTADVVNFARKLAKPLIIIDPDSGEITEERLDAVGGDNSEVDDASLRAIVERDYDSLDLEAINKGPKARDLVLQMIVLHLLAVGVGLLPLVYHWKGIWLNGALLLEVVFLALAFFLIYVHHGVHKEWIGARLEAEMCRSFLAFWNFPRDFDYFPRLASSWDQRTFRNLRLAWYMDGESNLPLKEVKANYLSARVRGQIGYYRKHFERSRFLSSVFRRTTRAFTLLAICAALAALLLSSMLGGEPEELYSTTKLLALLLPAVNASILSFLAANDLGRRVDRYQYMVQFLEDIESKMTSVVTWSGLWRVAIEAEECIAREVAEWESVARVAKDSH